MATICDRFGTSDREAASIISATMKDLGLVNESDNNLVVDRNKVRRARAKERKDKLYKEIDKVVGLYFDGRKDHTLVRVEKNGYSKNVKTIEEHITLIAEPGNRFIDHVAPPNGTSKIITKEILNFIDEHKISIDYISAIGCDGTNCNTGWKNGIIRSIEDNINKPLQWIICLLHANELPFRRLFMHLDGATSGPNTYTGLIGKSLKYSTNFKTINFKTIPTILPTITSLSTYSTDQKYLYLMCSAISTGIVSPKLADMAPGKLSHARWLTTANNILRTYVGTENPSTNLVTLVTYIIR